MAAKIQRVRVTRSFRHRGEDYGVDSVLDLDMATAQEMRSAKRGEFVDASVKLEKRALPPKKERPVNRGNVQIAALNAQIESLTAQVAELKAMVEKLSKPAKEKANAQ